VRVGRGGGVRRVTVGAVLPRGSAPASVTLDGHLARYAVTTTDRGVEVTVAAPAGRHVLTVRT
jgi:hypothetical protein